MRSVFALLSLVAIGLAAPAVKNAGRTSAPAGCLVVGGSGKYKTVSAAVKGLSTSTTSSQCIFINSGTYQEQVVITGIKSPLVIYGYTTDTSSYAGNKVTITAGKSQADGLNDDGTATLRAETANLKVYNINLVNSKGEGSQALAVSANNDKQGYYGVSFKGYQDTILAETGAQVYARCYIEGATDFIFGQRGTAWFDGVTIGVLAAASGFVTASGRDSASNPSYYVINNSKVGAAPGNNVKAGAFYLGRPWGAYARVIFQNTSLSNVINSAGWTVWQPNDARTGDVTFAEYNNNGAGASGKRVSYSKKLSSAISITTVLGSGYKSWVDTSYLS